MFVRQQLHKGVLASAVMIDNLEHDVLIFNVLPHVCALTRTRQPQHCAFDQSLGRPQRSHLLGSGRAAYAGMALQIGDDHVGECIQHAVIPFCKIVLGPKCFDAFPVTAKLSELVTSAQRASRVAPALDDENRQTFERIDCAADLHIS